MTIHQLSLIDNISIFLQDPDTYIDIENISGIVYFPGTIVLKPFKQLGLEDFKNDYDINVLGLLKILKYYQSSLIDGSSLVLTV